MGYLLLALSLVIFTLAGYYQGRHGISNERVAVTAVTAQQARETVQLINAVNDYLYDHPEGRQSPSEVTLTGAQIGWVPSATIHHVIFQRRVYVWQLPQPGLMAALKQQTVSSALLGTVIARRLVDNGGVDMGVAVPSAVPDGALVYLH